MSDERSDAAAPADLERAALRKVGQRLVPFLALLYFAAFIDRANVSFAALQMNRDLGLSPYVYGLGAGVFFIGYCLFEIPSNLILHRVGGRLWIARIMITWSIVAGAMAWVRGPEGFYALRFLLGIAEAGFFPGILYYLTGWVPAAQRGRVVASFMTAIPLSTALGGVLSAAILRLDGLLGLAGWQWLYLTETLPSLILGIATLICLPQSPAEARWLTSAEKESLTATLAAESAYRRANYPPSVLSALADARTLSLSLCYFGIEIGLYGVIFWVPQLLEKSGVAVARVGYVVAIPYGIAAAGMVWWCRHSDRMRERVRHLAAAALVGFLGLAASAWLSASSVAFAAEWSVVAITFGALGTLAVLPVFWTLPMAVLSGAGAAAAIALINSFGNLGGFAGPYLIGWIRDATGEFTYGLLAVACAVLLTGILALLIGHDAAAERAGAPLPARPRRSHAVSG